MDSRSTIASLTSCCAVSSICIDRCADRRSPMSYATAAHQHPAEEPYAQRWPAMITLLIGGFMNLIDITIVNVALPRLQASLGASSTEIEWVVAAYVLAFALGVLPFGRLGDIVGRKRMFLAGVALFTLFSALCGLAPS